MNPIYLDYAATTPLDVRVAKKMQLFLTADGTFGNPASLHLYGQQAKESVEIARAQVAALIQAEPNEIIWTSGATESDNLAIKGIAQLYQRKGKHIITMKTEHKAVLDACQYLEKEGYFVTYLSPEANGLLDLDKLKASFREDTILVSIMHVNNETGIIQDIKSIAHLTSSRGIFLHVDAAQSAGKVPIHVNEMSIDLLSLSAHKIYGPKGIGALFIRKRPRVRVTPLIHGGGHEQGMRSGTLATHQIVGMGQAFDYAQQEMQQDTIRISQLRTRLLAHLRLISYLKINGNLGCSVPHILNLRFEGMIAEDLLNKLPDLAISSSSACFAKGTESSYVLRAMGLNDQLAKSSLRLSFGRFTTEDEIDRAAACINKLFLKS